MQYTINGNLLNIEHLDVSNDSNIEKDTKDHMLKCNINSDEVDTFLNLLNNSSVDENDSEKFGNFMKLLNKIGEIENEEISSCMSMVVDDFFIKNPPPTIEGRKDIIETGEVQTSTIEEEKAGGVDLKIIIFFSLLLLIFFYKNKF